MEIYKDIDGDSGVAAYENGENFIRVKFKDGSIYLYTYASTGQGDIEHMKSLAIAGDGLNSYINKYVRKAYETREA